MSDPESRSVGLLAGLGRLWRRAEGRFAPQRLRLEADLETSRAELGAVTSSLEEVRAELARLRAEVRNQRSWLEAASARTEEVGGRLQQGWEDFHEALTRLEARVPADVPLQGSEALPLERFDAGMSTEVLGFRNGGSAENARVYLGFEDFFRGSEELIRRRQSAYRPLLEGRGPVLDVGCGRGEMLELLRAWRTPAEGIDLDPAMVAHCHAKGLEAVRVAGAAEYLEATDEAAFGAVFAAQVIEHLPYTDLVRFLRASCVALAPGGMLIAETVNPHSPQALKHFWIDPTHQHPLFPEAVIALCRLTGFRRAFVWYPQGSRDLDRDRLEQPDYAVVAHAPAG